MEVTEDDLYLLRHMLGLTNQAQKIPQSHRNYAAMNPGDARMARLVSLGLVVKYRDPAPGLPYEMYTCTEEGQRVAMESAMKRRYKKSRRVYRAYLSIRDLWEEMSFKDFLTHPDFKEMRRGA